VPGDETREQGGLADPRLTLNEHDPGQAVTDRPHLGVQSRQFAHAADELLHLSSLHPGQGTRGTYWGVATLPRFVVQLHDATTLHFDFRLQSGEVLRSWAVPKGPSLDPGIRRLAVPVEDHSMSAGEFEGVLQGHRRGSGAVIIWDEGTAEMVRDEPGHISFILHGRKLSGGFALTRTGRKRWILVKVRDEAARPGSDIVTERSASVRSGKTWQELRDR
jgi:DNA ligase D-like protein (predicted 3'-phosphoesterase)